MKSAITYGYTFNSSAHTIDLEDTPAFDIKKLFAIINLTERQIIYAVGTPGLGYVGIVDAVVELEYDTSDMNDLDQLQIIYDDSFTIQNVIGNAVNNESVGQYANPAILPTKCTMVGGQFDQNTEFRPLRVEDDGSLFVKIINVAATDISSVGGVFISQGRKAANFSMPVVLSNEDVLDQFITGFGPTTSVINTNLLLAVTGTGSIDCQQYRSIAFQINCSASTTVVTVNFEGSNDNVNFVPVQMFDKATPASAPVTSYNTAANVNRFWEGPVYFRYFRARISAAIVAGSARAFTMLRMAPFTNPTQFIGQGSSLATVSTVTGVTTVASITSANLASAFLTAIASAAIITTTTSASIPIANVQSMSWSVNVTAVSGTNPTLDVSIEETLDNGTTWFKVYDFERITANGSYRTPLIQIAGSAYRVVRTVSGTTPSFTMSMTGVSRSGDTHRVRRLINRTIDPNTLNSVTAAIEIRGSSKVSIVQSSNAGAIVSPVLTLQGSEDSLRWYDLPATLTCAASTVTQAKNLDDLPAFVRLRVSTAGTSASLEYVLITAQ